MIRYLTLILFILASCQATTSNKIKLISFNIRYKNNIDDVNNWDNRKSNLITFLKAEKPDIICLQEVLYTQLTYIDSELTNYCCIGVGRSNGKKDGEYTPIFYDTTKLVLVESSNFGLSETPNIIGKIGWDAYCPRIVTWLRLRYKKDNKSFFIANTHLDHKGSVARQQSIKLINDWYRLYIKDEPFVLTGDFNVDPNSLVYKMVVDAPMHLNDAYTNAKKRFGVSYSFHNYGKLATNSRKRIDYVFVNNKFKVKKMDIPKEIDSNGVFLSDHNPVIVHLFF